MTGEYVPGLEGVPATRSNISFVDGKAGVLEYRGIPIDQLAESSTFLETSFLLIFSHLPIKEELLNFEGEVLSHRRVKYRIRDMIKSFPESGRPMVALQCCIAALGMFYPVNVGTIKEEHTYESTIRLMAKLPTMVAMFHQMRLGNDPVPPRDDLGHAANFLYMLTGKEPDPRMSRIFDVCLMLHAEHTVNASTFSALVTGSTLADPYTVITSAAGTLSGPLHGGANEEVMAMLREIGTVEQVRPYIEDRLARKQKIMGIGHRVYKVKDPRATILQNLAIELFDKFGHSRLYDIAVEVERVCDELIGAKGLYPNVDFYSGLVYDKMGIPPDLYTPVFAISRVAGWLAHWHEQLADNRIFRPTQVYTGKHDVEYTPLSLRAYG
jgi:citrate synthase